MPRAACLAALVWCALVLFVHWAASAFACGWDTSYCANSRDKNGLYTGVLVDRQGRRLTETSFSVLFESRRDADPRDVDGFSTDARGRYCIVWAQESVTPFARVDGYETSIDVPWEPLNGDDAPPGCQAGDNGIPWNRADDLKTSAQFIALPALAGPAMILLLVGLVVGARRPAWPRTAGLALTAASTLLAAVLWLL